MTAVDPSTLEPLETACAWRTGDLGEDYVFELCADPDIQVAMTMRPGDMQFVNNHHVLHARRGYEDDRPAGRIRHLKRLWLETDLLSDEDKPEQFRLGRTDNWWASPGRTKSEVVV